MLAVSGPRLSLPDNPHRKGSPLGMPRSMKVAIGMYVAASLILSVVGIGVGIGGGHASERLPAPGQVAAGGSGQSGATGATGGGGDTPGSIGGSIGASEGTGAAGTASGSTPGAGAPGTGSGATPGAATPTAIPIATPTGTAAATPFGPTPTPIGPTPTPIGPTPTAATPSPTATAADSDLYLVITTLPASVISNSDVTLGATSVAGASCSAKVKYKSGKASPAPGLSKKQTADSAGKVAWVWTVDPDPGIGKATVKCKLNSKSAEKTKDFLVL